MDALLRRRIAELCGIALLVVAMVAGLVLATGGGAAPSTSKSPTTVSALLAGIPQDGDVLGQADAPVTLRWFGDLECPFCREFTLGALPSIIEHWVRSGWLRIEYRSMETATHDPSVFRNQQVAALAAGMQNKMWNFLELFYHEQGEEDSGYVTESYLAGLARQIPGLNVTTWQQDRNDPQLSEEVAADKRIVTQEHFRGTPSFLIGRTGEAMRRFTSASLSDPTRFNEAIELLQE